MSPALLAYVARSFVATQRYVAPVVLLGLVGGAVLMSPPLDASAALLVAVFQLPCSMWLTWLALSMEGPAQAYVTAARCGSRTAPRTAEQVVATVAALAVPVTVLVLATLAHALRSGENGLWWTAVLAPTLAGVGLGSLVHALLPDRPGQAALVVLLLVCADLVVPGAPPLRTLAAAQDGPTSWPIVAATAGGSAVLAVLGLTASHLLRRRA